MPRAGLTRARVASVAAEVADEVGLERLTLAAVAQRLGVSGPALYKHVAGLDALQRDVAVVAGGGVPRAPRPAAGRGPPPGPFCRPADGPPGGRGRPPPPPRPPAP